MRGSAIGCMLSIASASTALAAPTTEPVIEAIDSANEPAAQPADAPAAEPAPAPVSPPADQVAEQVRAGRKAAIAAAQNGQCDLAIKLAMNIAKLDQRYYEERVADRPVIRRCIARLDREEGDEVRDDRPGTPPLHGGRLFGEVLIGGGLLFGAGFAAGMLAWENGGGEDGVLAAVTAGVALGATAGVYAIGAIGDEDGSLPATFLGAAIGAGFANLYVRGQHLESEELVLVLAMPLAGAMVGFNVTRRWDERRVRPLVQASTTGATAGFAGTF